VRAPREKSLHRRHFRARRARCVVAARGHARDPTRADFTHKSRGDPVSRPGGITTTHVANELCLQPDAGRRHSRPAARYVSDGRALLARLGVWPWSIEETLSARRLQKDPRNAVALAYWHRAAQVAAYVEPRMCMPQPGPWRHVFRPAPPAGLRREAEAWYDAELRRAADVRAPGGIETAPRRAA
jgi:hypothetical protein